MGAGLSARSGSTGAALYRPKDSQFGTVSLQRSNAMPDMSSKQVASVCCKTLACSLAYKKVACRTSVRDQRTRFNLSSTQRSRELAKSKRFAVLER